MPQKMALSDTAQVQTLANKVSPHLNDSLSLANAADGGMHNSSRGGGTVVGALSGTIKATRKRAGVAIKLQEDACPG